MHVLLDPGFCPGEQRDQRQAGVRRHQLLQRTPADHDSFFPSRFVQCVFYINDLRVCYN